MQRQTCGEILRRFAPQNDTLQNHSDAVLDVEAKKFLSHAMKGVQLLRTVRDGHRIFS
jgi:hypothetical protein